MIRIWRGIEQEGVDAASVVETLFVCSDVFVSFSLLKKVLQDNKDIRAIYFGAGRKAFMGMFRVDWTELLTYCTLNDITIVIEVEPDALKFSILRYSNPCVTFIVAHYNIPKDLQSKLYFKTDDFITTQIYAVAKTVDITGVVDDRYASDILIYEED